MDNFSHFALTTQFHMASRLYLWFQHPEYAALLKTIQHKWIVGSHASSIDHLRFLAIETQPTTRPRNSLHIRQPFLEKYPLLDVYNPVLSRIHFLSTIYAVDHTQDFLQLFPEQDVRQLAYKLLQDEDALMKLSTYAINFLYFLHYDILHEDIPADSLLRIARHHPPQSDPDLIQLSIYFYTHCILGESRFYYQTIPKEKRSTYQHMLQACEQLIVDNFSHIHLDNKLEFLVCARMLQMPTRLEDAIYTEVTQSLSKEGTHLIDRVNTFPQKHRRTLETSEHRNILFLMSLADYSPIHLLQ